MNRKVMFGCACALLMLMAAANARAAWDEKKQTVFAGDGRNQISLLEAAIDRSSPEIVAEQWAKAHMTRNGALEYALLSETLRNEKKDDYEGFHFFMGTSSPWVDSYVITKKETWPDGPAFEVELCLTTSTREKSYSLSTLTLERDTRDAPDRSDAERWCITSVNAEDSYGFAPGLLISAGDTEIPYDVSKMSADGEEYARGVMFQAITTESIPTVALGNTVDFRFYPNGPRAVDAPVSAELFDYVLDAGGNHKYNENADGALRVEFEGETGCFTLEAAPASWINPNTEDRSAGAAVRGFRLICQWENRSCEYIFVLRADENGGESTSDGGVDKRSDAAPVIKSVEVLDENNMPLPMDSGWVGLQAVNNINVVYEGEAAYAEFYTVPTGTETFLEQRLIGSVDVQKNDRNAMLEWNAPEGFLGYIWVVVYNGDVARTSMHEFFIKAVDSRAE